VPNLRLPAALHPKVKSSDYLPFALALVFGLWWLVLPRSVVSFYGWFHKGRVKMPATFVVRLVGVFWIVLVSIVVVLASR
jgi:hypothetical protein